MENIKPTRADARVLRKASLHPVMIAGGFSGKPWPGATKDSRFDTALIIERGVARGWLEGGVFANQYCLTAKGRAIFEALPPHLRHPSDA